MGTLRAEMRERPSGAPKRRRRAPPPGDGHPANARVARGPTARAWASTPAPASARANAEAPRRRAYVAPDRARDRPGAPLDPDYHRQPVTPIYEPAHYGAPPPRGLVYGQPPYAAPPRGLVYGKGAPPYAPTPTALASRRRRRRARRAAARLRRRAAAARRRRLRRRGALATLSRSGAEAYDYGGGHHYYQPQFAQPHGFPAAATTRAPRARPRPRRRRGQGPRRRVSGATAGPGQGRGGDAAPPAEEAPRGADAAPAPAPDPPPNRKPGGRRGPRVYEEEFPTL
ncbi:hypothetical protein JL720_4008 [Aureococcus anophagefferens]|nr:hypothetical protein JL720_4008 [Aureococcus anophagefferens]